MCVSLEKIIRNIVFSYIYNIIYIFLLHYIYISVSNGLPTGLEGANFLQMFFIVETSQTSYINYFQRHKNESPSFAFVAQIFLKYY